MLDIQTPRNVPRGVAIPLPKRSRNDRVTELQLFMLGHTRKDKDTHTHALCGETEITILFVERHQCWSCVGYIICTCLHYKQYILNSSLQSSSSQPVTAGRFYDRRTEKVLYEC